MRGTFRSPGTRETGGIRTGLRWKLSAAIALVGRVPGLENAFVATGFEGDGICLGPVTGQSIVQLICGEKPSIDLSFFDPARFGSYGAAA